VRAVVAAACAAAAAAAAAAARSPLLAFGGVRSSPLNATAFIIIIII
jgi:hypothetical protein